MKLTNICKTVIGTGIVALAIGIIGEGSTLGELKEIPNSYVEKTINPTTFQSDISKVEPKYKAEAERLQNQSRYFHYLAIGGCVLVISGGTILDYKNRKNEKNN